MNELRSILSKFYTCYYNASERGQGDADGAYIFAEKAIKALFPSEPKEWQTKTCPMCHGKQYTGGIGTNSFMRCNSCLNGRVIEEEPTITVMNHNKIVAQKDPDSNEYIHNKKEAELQKELSSLKARMEVGEIFKVLGKVFISKIEWDTITELQKEQATAIVKYLKGEKV